MNQNNSSYCKIKNCFIANRGEVAKRICLSLKKLGIYSTCVCSSREASFFSSFADHLIVAEDIDTGFYLDGKKLIDIATKNGCDSLHPGYGFLSEDPGFCSLVEASSLRWIGPSSKVMALLSSKESSSNLARNLAIPCSQSCLISNEELLDGIDVENIKKRTSSFNYPLLIKGVLSGGGKGMRVCEDPGDLYGLVQKSSLECRKYFGSGSLLIEEFHKNSRHIEVQVVADSFSNVFTLGTRDCSVQRRNQKIIETSPADISNEVFQKLCDYSRSIIKESGYDSIATVEFLVDSKNRVYFLEVNTRLQVEHPVTEMLYGLDLVELQVQIASGLNLKESKYIAQLQKIDAASIEDPTTCMELRICGEDPRTLLPVSGRVMLSVDTSQSETRWDLGIKNGEETELSSCFDSLLGKCIVRGKSRSDCILKLQKALKYNLFIGITNVALFRKILKDQDFIENRVNTEYLKKHMDSFYPDSYSFEPSSSSKKFLSIRELIPGYFNELGINQSKSNLNSDLPPDLTPSYKISKKSETNTTSKNIGYSYNTSSSRVKNTRSYDISSRLSSVSKYKIYPKVPAKVNSLLKGVGDLVKPGDTIFILESMKMEIEVKSEVEGRIISLSSSSWVNTTDLLAELEPLKN